MTLTALRVGTVVVLTSDETAELRAALPPARSGPMLDLLSQSSGAMPQPEAVAALYSYIDVRLRDAIDDAWYSSAQRPSEPLAYELIETAMGRLSEGYPWLLDYIFGPCDGCGGERAQYLRVDGTWARLSAGEACDQCGSEVVPARTCPSCNRSSVRGRPLCPHCGAAYDGSSPGWL